VSVALSLWLGSFLILSFVTQAEARVFNYQDSGLAAYVRGTGGQSSAGGEAFQHASGTDTFMDEKAKYQYGGEAGFLMSFGTFALRFGAEMLEHQRVEEAQGVDTSGIERFKLNSTIFVFNPNVTLEYIYATYGNFRLFMAGGAGYAMVTVENTYAMTTQGTTDLGVTDFKEKLEAAVVSGTLNTGFETLFTDNATLMMDIGYRYMPVRTLKHKGPNTTIVGSVDKGDTAMNSNGTKRQLDLGGLYAGLAFRFYLNFL
jgi:hypothetical protein